MPQRDSVEEEAKRILDWEKSARLRKIRNARSLVAITMGILAIGGFLLAAREEVAFWLREQTFVVSFVALGIIALGFAQVLLLYLRGIISFPGVNESRASMDFGFDAFRPVRIREEAIEELREQLASIRRESEEISLEGRNLSNSERERLLASLKSTITQDVASIVGADLEARFGQAARDKLQFDLLRRPMERAGARLSEEIAKLTRTSNLNLVFGTVTTVFAGTALAYMVFRNGTTFKDLPSLLSYYVPRLTTIVFAEVFAFFFLRLYKANLADIKYYQNELTTLALRSVALEQANQSSDAKASGVLIERFSMETRNSVTDGHSESKPFLSRDLEKALARVLVLLEKSSHPS